MEYTFEDISDLVNQIKDRWVRSSLINTYFIGEDYFIELHTGGDSENEEFMESIKETPFYTDFWFEIKRGGHYYLKINLRQIGYKPAKDFCKEKGFTRQNLSKTKHRYSHVLISANKIYYKDFN